MTVAEPPTHGVTLPPPTLDQVAAVSIELTELVEARVRQRARKRPGPAVATPEDVWAVYRELTAPKDDGGTLFNLSLFFLGLGGGGLMTVLSVPEEARPAVLVWFAIAFIFMGVALGGAGATLWYARFRGLRH